MAVGAIQLGDGMASFSNGGCCVDIMAPGVDVISAAPGSPTATACVQKALHISANMLTSAVHTSITVRIALNLLQSSFTCCK